MILLTLIWLTSTPDSEQTDSGIVPPSPIAPIHREAGATSPSGTAESPSPVTPAVSSARLEIPAQQADGEIARALIAALRNGQQQLDADSLLNRALELQQQGRVTDAYLLLFFNARNGHGPSAMLLGELHDPAHFTTGSTANPGTRPATGIQMVLACTAERRGASGRTAGRVALTH